MPLRPSLPWPWSTRPRGCCPSPQARAPAVVLEAGEHTAAAAAAGRRQRDLDRDVADQPGPVLANGAHVEQANPRNLMPAEQVGVTEQLVAAADPEHDRAARGGRMQGLRACCRSGPRRTAADRGPGRRRGRTDRGRRRPAPRRVRCGPARSRFRARRSGAPARAGCRGRRRCSSGPRTARTRAAAAGACRAGRARVGPNRGSGTEHHHGAAEVLLGRADLPDRRRGEACAHALVQELGRGDPVERDHVACERGVVAVVAVRRPAIARRRGCGARARSPPCPSRARTLHGALRYTRPPT